jgi:hypothetical protein
MKPLKVYLAWFITGEYDDRRESVEKVFSNEEQAKAFVLKQNTTLKEFNLHRDSKYPRSESDYALAQSYGGPAIDTGGAEWLLSEHDVEPAAK